MKCDTQIKFSRNYIHVVPLTQISHICNTLLNKTLITWVMTLPPFLARDQNCKTSCYLQLSIITVSASSLS